MNKVEVVWEDTIYKSQGWEDLNDVLIWAEKENSKVTQIGYVLYQDDDHILICSENLSGEVTQIYSATRIPMSCIESITELK